MNSAHDGRHVRVTYDAEVDAAYIYLRDIEAGGVQYSHVVEWDEPDVEVVLDVDHDGRLVGIEVLGAAGKLPPSLLAGAERLDLEQDPPD